MRMLTRKMAVELVPEDGTYTGSARMLFCDPEGSVDGKAIIRVSAGGNATVRIDVERYSIPAEYHNLLMAFLQGSKPEQAGGVRTTFHIGEINRFGSLEVTTAEGTFRADRALVGDLAECERCANASLLNGRTPYVHFAADGHDCGLVIFGAGDPDPAPDRKFGAAVFGVIGNRLVDSADEVNALIPWGLFAALSFASGSDVQAPWIELRGRGWELKRRLHRSEERRV